MSDTHGKSLRAVTGEDQVRLNRLAEEIAGRLHEMKLIVARNLGVDAKDIRPVYGVPRAVRMDFSGQTMGDWSMWIYGDTVCVQDGDDWSCWG